MLKKQLTESLIAAVKNKDKESINTIRLIIAAIKDKEIAIILGNPKAARAVANACKKNPYPIIIPCHRVIRSDGTLGGFSARGGIKLKKRLLNFEN